MPCRLVTDCQTALLKLNSVYCLGVPARRPRLRRMTIEQKTDIKGKKQVSKCVSGCVKIAGKGQEVCTESAAKQTDLQKYRGSVCFRVFSSSVSNLDSRNCKAGISLRNTMQIPCDDYFFIFKGISLSMIFAHGQNYKSELLPWEFFRQLSPTLLHVHHIPIYWLYRNKSSWPDNGIVKWGAGNDLPRMQMFIFAHAAPQAELNYIASSF